MKTQLIAQQQVVHIHGLQVLLLHAAEMTEQMTLSSLEETEYNLAVLEQQKMMILRATVDGR
jgi:hypothetical protein